MDEGDELLDGLRGVTDRDIEEAVFRGMYPGNTLGLSEQPETLRRTIARVRAEVCALLREGFTL